jgi:hypothetical protein
LRRTSACDKLGAARGAGGRSRRAPRPASSVRPPRFGAPLASEAIWLSAFSARWAQPSAIAAIAASRRMRALGLALQPVMERARIGQRPRSRATWRQAPSNLSCRSAEVGRGGKLLLPRRKARLSASATIVGEARAAFVERSRGA